MGNGRDEGRHASTIPVHGGTCTVDRAAGVVRFEQSVWRHLHPLAWLTSGVALSLAAYSAATGWCYVGEPGQAMGPVTLAVLGGILPLFALGRRLWFRLSGVTATGEVPLAAVESVRLTTTEIRWYFKTRRAVPVLLVEYRTDGTVRTRRAMLAPRFDDGDVGRTVDAFESAGLAVDVDDAVRSASATR